MGRGGEFLPKTESNLISVHVGENLGPSSSLHATLTLLKERV